MSSRQETRSRRRAAKACSYCRKRKRKCDGRTPVCSLCEEYNDSQCVYEPTQLRRSAATRAENRDEAASGPQTTDATRDSTLLRASFGDADAATPELSRLDREQNRIEESRRHATCPVLGSPASQDRGFEGSFPTSSPCSAETVSTAGTVDSHTDAAMAIPLAHQTTTGDLLHSEAGRQLLGEYPADLFLRIEARRFTPIDISLDLDRDAKDPENPLSECDDVYIKHLLDVFFDQAHPQIPIFSRDQVMRMLPEAVASPAMSLESALISLLASIASTLLEEPDTTSGEWTPGHRFFKPALRSIVAKWHTDFSGDLILAQSLFMAAVYYSHLARPLQAWRMVHLASTCVQHHTVSSRQLDKLEQMILRLCWAIFNLECDIIAEYHLPRSGIEQLVEKLPFPSCGELPDVDMLRWLANLASRQLLNRIHHFLYGRSQASHQVSQISSAFVGNDPYTEELSRQLQAWSNLIPEHAQPDLDQPVLSATESIIVLRNHAAGDIIFRHDLLHVLENPSSRPEARVVEKARRCLYYCRAYLAAVGSRTQSSHASLEITLHSALAAILLLTRAALSPWLADAAEVVEMNLLHDETIAYFQKWAFPGSSIEAMLSVAQSIKAKFDLLR